MHSDGEALSFAILLTKICVFVLACVASWAIFAIFLIVNFRICASHIFDITTINTTFVCWKQIEMVQRLYHLDIDEHEYNRANSSTD